MKLLISTNLEHKSYGLKRVHIKNYTSSSSIAYNLRKYVHNLGYNPALLTDNEILSLEEAVYEHESNINTDYLIELLDFLTCK
jgi:hypothetical protein